MVLSNTSAHKLDTTRTILYAYCVVQHRQLDLLWPKPLLTKFQFVSDTLFWPNPNLRLILIWTGNNKQQKSSNQITSVALVRFLTRTVAAVRLWRIEDYSGIFLLWIAYLFSFLQSFFVCSCHFPFSSGVDHYYQYVQRVFLHSLIIGHDHVQCGLTSVVDIALENPMSSLNAPCVLCELLFWTLWPLFISGWFFWPLYSVHILAFPLTHFLRLAGFSL